MGEAGGARAELLADGGAAAVEDEFFRCREFLEAEGTTHTLVIEQAAPGGGSKRAAIPVLVREIEGSGGLRDAISPYSYPGGRIEGGTIEAAAVDWSATGLVSLFLRERLGDPPALTGPQLRSKVQVSDPDLPRKSRMSDRQQIRKNEAAGYELRDCHGPEASPQQLEDFHRVYTETMVAVSASDRYMFDLAYFELLFSSPLTRLFEVLGPEGDVAAAAIAARSDGYIHYYLSGTADDHRRRAPSKNLIVAVTDHAEEQGLPMNLGGGIKPGDGLEEFKRGFANAEHDFRTHEIVCDPERYGQLSGEGAPADPDFFPAYRATR